MLNFIAIRKGISTTPGTCGLEFLNMLPYTFLLPTQFENMKPSPCHSQELKELNQWPLFLVTFRLDYASFLDGNGSRRQAEAKKGKS